MKKLLFLCAAFLIVGTARAQNGLSQTYRMDGKTAQLTSKTLDTLTNADSSYVVFPSIGAGYNIHIVATVTKISGTVAGALTFMGTDDLTNAASFDTLANVVSGPTSSNYANQATQGNATASYDWFYCGSTPYKYKYYMIRYISSGTQTSSFTGTTYYRKP